MIYCYVAGLFPPSLPSEEPPRFRYCVLDAENIDDAYGKGANILERTGVITPEDHRWCFNDIAIPLDLETLKAIKKNGYMLFPKRTTVPVTAPKIESYDDLP